MKGFMILGIHTATEKLSIALYDGTNRPVEKMFTGPTAKTEMLVRWIKDFLKEQKISPEQLNAIGIVNGPGAFTGLRLGMITAKTFAYTLNIPLYGFSLFDGIVFQYLEKEMDGNFAFSFHACRNQVNACLFTIANGVVTAKKDILAIEQQEYEALANKGYTVIEPSPHATSICHLAAKKLAHAALSELGTIAVQYSHAANIRLSEKPELKKLREGT